jgi:ATP-dependent HslUV protease ATP-binding subunit HslU
MLVTDSVRLDFKADGIRRLAEIAWSVNEKTENIGARRLYTVMEKLLEEVSFEAGRGGEREVVIDSTYVDERLEQLAASEDLARYVL